MYIKMLRISNLMKENAVKLKRENVENPSLSPEICNLSSGVSSVRDQISFNQSVVENLFTDILREI